MGTQDGRQVSIVNTFELKLSKEDVDMDTSSSTGGGGGGGGGSRWTYDRAFMDKRRAQCKPNLSKTGIHMDAHSYRMTRPRSFSNTRGARMVLNWYTTIRSRCGVASTGERARARRAGQTLLI